MIKEMLPKSANKEFNTDECDTLEKALNKLALETEGYGILDTEEKLWNFLDNENLYEGFLIDCCIEPLCLNNVDETTDIIECYNVTNPDNEISNVYVAAENGIYTFKIKDIVTGKSYTKKVEVNNVDESIKDKYQVVNSPSKYVITLQNKATSELAKFSKAYIIVEGELKDISEIIEIDESQNYNYIWSNDIPGESFGIAENEEYEFILINDEGVWKGKAVVQREVY